MTKAIAYITAYVAMAIIATILILGTPFAKADDPQECVKIETQVTQAVRDQVEAQGGKLVEVRGEDAETFQAGLEQAFGGKAPFHADYVAIAVYSDEEVSSWGAVFAAQGCVVHAMYIPRVIASRLLGLSNDVVKGEKVD